MTSEPTRAPQPFRLRDDAKEWFKALYEKDFRIGFDAFYFCFMAGIATGKKVSTPNSAAPELISYFPERYAPRKQVLVALFLTQELEDLGIKMSEKKDVHAKIKKLLEPNSSGHHLSEEGVKEFNKYAHGGFEVLRDEWFDDRPRSLETFLRIFKQELDEAIAKRKLAEVVASKP
ncbi:hypothetical protein [Streptomyces sp. NRRL F-2580]|uniref:hypothetical protein n=1 Tax=Streptomyces sp. NRRL F-2580 TaxID=1463841 RepID=UPI000691B735|nr:hypothetical protein [Streptomyces sp. NRRL F-2580]